MISLNKLANRLAIWLVKNGATEDNYEIYAYGAECVLSEIIANFVVFSISFLFGFALEMLFWQIFWLPLRLQIGGFHSRISHLNCIIISTAVAVGSVLVIPLIESTQFIIWLGIIISIIVAFTIAPVLHKNHPMSARRMQKAKIWGRLICVMEALVVILLYYIAPMRIAYSAFLGMFVACLMCIVGKIYAILGMNDVKT